ncbi:MAG: GNAT family N-acetyltransferase [Chloroflexi bacterium]|nr:GNAT family N-acetyltransferase [Chloroflexota bacterium]
MPKQPGIDADELEIRIAAESDLESLAESFAHGTSAAQLQRRLEESKCGLRTMLLADLEGRAVGAVSIGGWGHQREGSLRLFALDVGPAFQCKGVGTALIKAVEAIAADRDLDEVNLEVEIDNDDAIRLYRRLGYRICGDPVMDRWQLMNDDGSSETVEVPVFVMVKRLV